jgi:hypothetical protein
MSGTKGVENPMQRLVESARRVVSKECSLVLSDSDRLSVLQWIPASVFADFMATKSRYNHCSESCTHTFAICERFLMEKRFNGNKAYGAAMDSADEGSDS